MQPDFASLRKLGWEKKTTTSCLTIETMIRWNAMRIMYFIRVRMTFIQLMLVLWNEWHSNHITHVLCIISIRISSYFISSLSNFIEISTDVFEWCCVVVVAVGLPLLTASIQIELFRPSREVKWKCCWFRLAYRLLLWSVVVLIDRAAVESTIENNRWQSFKNQSII